MRAWQGLQNKDRNEYQKIFLWVKQLAHKADNLTTICEPIV
jgi:hypothetical protein